MDCLKDIDEHLTKKTYDCDWTEEFTETADNCLSFFKFFPWVIGANPLGALKDLLTNLQQTNI